ncbi:hypothetical protein [uncultured Christiangramia sp.]|uniref:hypothetical protein n=1 Tax=uncultured Christiangramia sp. TaxID=503836 RepID=UPI00262D9BFC|nr:hypothetical protein [uncultured Christiangramia sp.]
MNSLQIKDSLKIIGNCNSRKPIYAIDGKEMDDYKDYIWKLFNFLKPEGYRLNEANEKIILTLLPYYVKLPTFNKHKLIKNEASLDKGILLYGDLGVGKSMLFEIFHRMGRHLYNSNNTDFWFPKISTGSFVDQYMNSLKDNCSTFNLDAHRRGNLYIDDLGFERKAFNNHELIGELLFERYRNNALTFVTTNLSPKQISGRYGARIGDRLAEMFNIIKWEGESLRQ